MPELPGGFDVPQVEVYLSVVVPLLDLGNVPFVRKHEQPSRRSGLIAAAVATRTSTGSGHPLARALCSAAWIHQCDRASNTICFRSAIPKSTTSSMF